MIDENSNVKLIKQEMAENNSRAPLWAFAVLGIILIIALIYRFA
jgi:hypothetical protein